MTNLRLQNGTVLPQARVYATFGTLDAPHDNAVLLPSHYMADEHGYDWLIGPAKALDPTKYFIIATALFGNGKSSPSNTPAPFDGPRFPVTTIRDNVAAGHRLLIEVYGIHHLRAVIGFSMGGQQAFQLGVSYPGFADRIAATSARARTWPHGIVRPESQIIALTTDPAFADGNYTVPTKKRLEAFGAVCAAWLFSQEWWRDDLWRSYSPPSTIFAQVCDRFHSDSIPGADANDLIFQMRTWEATAGAAATPPTPSSSTTQSPPSWRARKHATLRPGKQPMTRHPSVVLGVLLAAAKPAPAYDVAEKSIAGRWPT